MRVDVLTCPHCDTELHRTSSYDLRPLAVVFGEAERACEDHLRERHPVRYRLWRRLRWRWLIAGLTP